MAILIACLGWIVGAAAAHLAESVTAHRRLARPVCPYCTAAYTLLQWSAMLALVTGQRRCGQCGKPFRIPRLVAELFVALTWGILWGRYGFSWRVLLAMLSMIPLAMIMVTDLEVKLVPNVITLPSIGLMLVIGTVFGPAIPTLRHRTWLTTIEGALVGFLVLRILVWLGVAIFGEGALGEGDITLATYIGAVVGFPMVLEALLLAFVLGGVGAVGVLITRRGRLNTAIPYGPFLILGCALTLLFGRDIVFWVY